MIPWTKVILGLLGVSVVVTLIAVPTAIFLNDEAGSRMKRPFTLSDVFNSSLHPSFYHLTWISDHEYLTNTNGSIILHNVINSTAVELLSTETFDRVDAYHYELSEDRKYVAFYSNYTQKEWKHTHAYSIHIYDLEKQDFLNTSDVLQEIQHDQWSPEGSKLAFVSEYNVYIKTSPAAPAQQVTFDGEYNRISNGLSDWVYDEEMSSQGIFWSPSGKYLAYAQFNDTPVHTMEYSWYGEDQYPRTVTLPYPKAGTPNPTVRLFVVEAENTTNISEVIVPPDFGSGDHYLCFVTWVTDRRLAVQWMKRKQNEVLIQIYKLSGNSWNADERLILSSRTGWIGRLRPEPPVFSADKSSYYLLTSDTNGYKHIHHVVGGKMKAITSGPWEVERILTVTTDSVYYSSNQEGGRPGGRNVYRWSAGRGSKCLTCGFEMCLYNAAIFSHNASFYGAACYGPAIPRLYLYDNRGSEVVEMRVLQHNKEVASRLSEIHMPTMRHGTVKIENLTLWYQMTLPPGFEESKKYPLLVDVYGGPASQTVNYEFQTGWSTYLASSERIIVASFDGRGSGYQGDHIMHAIYRRLGTYEVEDQITAVREFIKMGFIDENRIAIWGGSYGGYVTSMVLGSGSGLFKCGIAVAPVSNWEYYDSIYTERYMDQPSENPENYKNSSVTALAKNFHNVKYLLIHGLADDNVHFQHSAQISKALVEQEVNFEAMWYTDKSHDLEDTEEHHYTHMTNFLLKCFA